MCFPTHFRGDSMKAFIREAFVFLGVMAIIPFLATVVVLVAGAKWDFPVWNRWP